MDDEKLMGKSSRQRGPKVGEREKTHKLGENRENRGHMHQRPLKKCAKKSDRGRKREGRGWQVVKCLELTPTEST